MFIHMAFFLYMFIQDKDEVGDHTANFDESDGENLLSIGQVWTENQNAKVGLFDFVSSKQVLWGYLGARFAHITINPDKSRLLNFFCICL